MSEAHAAVAVVSDGKSTYCGSATALRCSVTLAAEVVGGIVVGDVVVAVPVFATAVFVRVVVVVVVTGRGVPRPLCTAIEDASDVVTLMVTGSTSLKCWAVVMTTAIGRTEEPAAADGSGSNATHEGR